MTSEILLSKDMKVRNNHCVSVLKPYLLVLACLLIELHWTFKNWGCSLSMGATYTGTFTVMYMYDNEIERKERERKF